MNAGHFILLLLFLITLTSSVLLLFLWMRDRMVVKELENERTITVPRLKRLEGELDKQRREVARLAPWVPVADAMDQARQLVDESKAALAKAKIDAERIVADGQQRHEQILKEAAAAAAKVAENAKVDADVLRQKAQVALETATSRAAWLIDTANERAQAIAGEAYEVKKNVDAYRRTEIAMRNVIRGYGDEYLKPAASLLDDLAEAFSHKDAGVQLKMAREHTKAMVKEGKAATCEYSEASRRHLAIQFVLDSFNGKVDGILSRVRHDNHGKLEQEIRDAFTLVNHGGQAFREARITEPYLAARLAELKWGAVAQELKRQEQEEQRRFREWIREEAAVQREAEKALREAARDEDALRKAMEKAQAQIADATEAQRARYEAQLAELAAKLQEAEARSQRALSMAQQTRRGHVYIISNVGSFGENVYKIGLTRRLEPLDRVKELGDASVPFDFDVHAVILSDDAPALETKLHKHFVLSQVNKVNHRKEYFRANLAEIRQEIESLGIDAQWTMAAEAREYRETLAIERVIAEDPAARDAWINRQLTLDPVEEREMVAVGAEAE